MRGSCVHSCQACANSSIRKQKEQLKAMETPEEKRARRLAKKEAKERKKREKMGWDQEYMVGFAASRAA